MKHLFIINPAAGSRDRTKAYTETIEALCKGLDYRIEVSKPPVTAVTWQERPPKAARNTASTPAAATAR